MLPSNIDGKELDKSFVFNVKENTFYEWNRSKKGRKFEKRQYRASNHFLIFSKMEVVMNPELVDSIVTDKPIIVFNPLDDNDEYQKFNRGGADITIIFPNGEVIESELKANEAVTRHREVINDDGEKEYIPILPKKGKSATQGPVWVNDNIVSRYKYPNSRRSVISKHNIFTEETKSLFPEITFAYVNEGIWDPMPSEYDKRAFFYAVVLPNVKLLRDYGVLKANHNWVIDLPEKGHNKIKYKIELKKEYKRQCNYEDFKELFPDLDLEEPDLGDPHIYITYVSLEKDRVKNNLR